MRSTKPLKIALIWITLKEDKMKTLKVFYCDSYRSFPNFPHDHTYEMDHDGVLRVSKITRNEQYETHELAVYRNWDYLEIEDEDL